MVILNGFLPELVGFRRDPAATSQSGYPAIAGAGGEWKNVAECRIGIVTHRLRVVANGYEPSRG